MDQASNQPFDNHPSSQETNPTTIAPFPPTDPVLIESLLSQYTLSTLTSPSWPPTYSLLDIRNTAEQFCSDRDWQQYHTPRNLLLALIGETGELSEIFQWKPDSACEPGLSGFSEHDKVHLSEELADVLIYLVRLASVCGVNLPEAVKRKFVMNARKYPVGEKKKF